MNSILKITAKFLVATSMFATSVQAQEMPPDCYFYEQGADDAANAYWDSVSEEHMAQMNVMEQETVIREYRELVTGVSIQIGLLNPNDPMYEMTLEDLQTRLFLLELDLRDAQAALPALQAASAAKSAAVGPLRDAWHAAVRALDACRMGM